MFGIISTALQTHVQKTLVTGLKDFFSQVSDFTYDTNSASTAIHILVEFPKRTVKYPTIVLGTIAGDPLQRTIGSQEFRSFRGTRVVSGLTLSNCICGYVSGGGHRVSIPIFIFSNTGSESRILKDYITMFFSVVYKKYLAQSGIHLVDITLNSGTNVLIGNEYIRVESMNVNFYTEWREVIYDVPLISHISSIGISTY